MILAAGTLAASRVFARAAVRYRLLAVAFGLVAAIGPLALAAAVLRPAAGTGGSLATGALALRLDALALPVFSLASAVAAALLLQLLFEVVRLRRIKRTAQPIGTAVVRDARIGTSETVKTPTAIGYLHPAVVVPADFRGRVDDGEWNAVIAHECAHLARRDDWAKALQSAVLRACWWLPGLWLLARALDLERELASDERAADETGPRRYAACLLRLATDRGTDVVAPALWGRRAQVAVRVERLLRPSARATPVARAGALGALTAVALAALAFAVSAVPPTGRLAASTARRTPRSTAPVPLAAHARAAVHVASLPVRSRHRTLASPVTAVPSDLAPATEPSAADATNAAAPTVPSARPVRRHRDPHSVTEIASVDEPVADRARPAAPTTRQAGHAPRAVRPALADGSPAADPSLGAPEFLAFARPHAQCPTCFGPLRSPDAASPGAPATTPSRFEPAPATLAIANDDLGGATDLRSRVFLIRLPRIAAP